MATEAEMTEKLSLHQLRKLRRKKLATPEQLAQLRQYDNAAKSKQREEERVEETIGQAYAALGDYDVIEFLRLMARQAVRDCGLAQADLDNFYYHGGGLCYDTDFYGWPFAMCGPCLFGEILPYIPAPNLNVELHVIRELSRAMNFRDVEPTDTYRSYFSSVWNKWATYQEAGHRGFLGFNRKHQEFVLVLPRESEDRWAALMQELVGWTADINSSGWVWRPGCDEKIIQIPDYMRKHIGPEPVKLFKDEAAAQRDLFGVKDPTTNWWTGGSGSIRRLRK